MPSLETAGSETIAVLVVVAGKIVYSVAVWVGKRIINAIAVQVDPAEAVVVGKAGRIVDSVAICVQVTACEPPMERLVSERDLEQIVDPVPLHILEPGIDATAFDPAQAMAEGSAGDIVDTVAFYIAEKVVDSVAIQISPARTDLS